MKDINFEESKYYYNRNKEHKFYHKKIDERTDNLRYIEENDRQNLLLDDNEKRLQELKELNEEYSVNGENFYHNKNYYL